MLYIKCSVLYVSDIIMYRIAVYIGLFTIGTVLCCDRECYEYFNRTDPATQQLYRFKILHPDPIGILTTSSGCPVEIRQTITLNSDSFSNQYHIDSVTHTNDERIPERVVHAKGAGAFGYFEVTHDVSQYTKADVFNGIGKVTQVVTRFSTSIQNTGGRDPSREPKAIAVKFYTNDGNLDLLSLSIPVYFYKDANDFEFFLHSFKRNPKTNLFDSTSLFDFVIKRPETLHAYLWVFSDFGIPNGYRKMDVFPIHTYEVYNKHGERYFIKFNFRSEQGIENLPSDEASARDLDYYNRDLYDAIENQDYPAWRLEFDVMSFEDIKKLDYDPFDVTRLWKKGTYKTVPVGRLVLNRNPDNVFRDVELSAYNPGNLVPGIPGPIDNMYKTRRSSYRDTQTYRLGVNHNKIDVNRPLYAKTYDRDGKPPVNDNMKDVPNYYPNSFNGPIPYVDPAKPKERLVVLESNAVDLDHGAYFYNNFLNDAAQLRLANNTAQLILPIAPFLQRRLIRLFTLVDPKLGSDLTLFLERALRAPPPPPPRVLKYSGEKY